MFPLQTTTIKSKGHTDKLIVDDILSVKSYRFQLNMNPQEKLSGQRTNFDQSILIYNKIYNLVDYDELAVFFN